MGQNKNKYQHYDDGTTHIFIESKSKKFPGKHTIIIDTEDWNKISDYRWHIRSSSSVPYAQANVHHLGKRKIVQIHHVIKGKPQKGKEIDHVNHNGLDNRKDNLREVTRSQNSLNKKCRRDCASRYKGVQLSKHSKIKKWRACVRYEGKSISLGYFATEKEAALAYNKKAVELWGEEHVYLNEVD